MTPEPYQRSELTRAGPPAHRLLHTVRLQDVDAAGVVFFAAAFEMFSDAFLAWCAELGWPITRMFSDARMALPIRHAEADYLAPLVLGDRLSVLVVGCRAESDEVFVGFRIEVENAAGASRAAVVGQTHHVCVGTEGFARRALPDELRRKLTLGLGG